MHLLTDMSSLLLREYIGLLVEAIKSRKGVSGSFGSKFDMNKFKSFNELQIIQHYAKTFLEPLGQGSSRVAYLLSGKYALKIALSKKGIAQNQTEVDVYTNPTSQPVVAKIYSSDDSFMWIISDLVKPIKSVSEFEQLSGLDWRQFSEIINVAIKEKHLPKDAPEFAKRVAITAMKNDMLRGDLAQQDFSHDATDDVIDHYGKTPDGRIVLLDYGLTGEVWNTEYKPGRDAFAGRKTAHSSEKTAKPGKSKSTIDPYGNTHAVPQAKSNVKTKPEKKGSVPPEGRTKPEVPARKKAVGAEEDLEKTGR